MSQDEETNILLRENEQLRAEIAELRRSTAQDRVLVGALEHCPDLIGLFSVEGVVLYANRWIRAEQVLGQHFTTFLEGNALVVWNELMSGALTTKTAQKREFTTVGDHRWSGQLIPIINDGEVTELLAIANDSTSQWRAERKIARNEGRLRVAVESTEMGMWSWDVANNAIHWDERTLNIFNREETPQSFDEYMSLVHVDDRKELQKSLDAAMKGEGWIPVVHRTSSKTEVRWLLCCGQVVYGDDGGIEVLLGGVFDVTHTRRLEEQLRQAQKMEAVGRLTAGIAHNFNNLLTAILPNLELSLMEAPEWMVGRLEEAEKAAFQASDMVRQLMLFSRPTRGARMSQVDVRTVVRTVGKICQRTFDRRIRLTLELPHEPAMVLANSASLEQAVLNIALNARDAVEPRDVGEIEVSVISVPGQYIIIRVEDNGIGIPKDSVPRLYEPFFTTKDIGSGTGLGLSTTYAIVQEHDGEIRCTSNPGFGTTFEIQIPWSEGAVDDPARSSPFGEALPRGEETVLIVDDEPAVRRPITAMLRMHGYNPLEAGSVKEALEVLERESVELLLLDYWMPEAGGDQLVHTLGDCEMKVVLLSGASVSEDLATQVDDVWAKPIRAGRLLRGVRALLDQS